MIDCQDSWSRDERRMRYDGQQNPSRLPSGLELAGVWRALKSLVVVLRSVAGVAAAVQSR